MSNKELAKIILKYIGGAGNIESFTRCSSRLRFELKDESIAKTSRLKEIRGVRGVLTSHGQYMLVIGKNVESVYKEIKNEICEAEKLKIRGKRHSMLKAVCYMLFFVGTVTAIAEILSYMEIINLGGNVLGFIYPVLNIILYSIPLLIVKVYKTESGQIVDEQSIIVHAPIKGGCINIEEKPDFKIDAAGYVIFPENNLVVAPLDATVIEILEKGNGAVLRSDEGAELLIKIGTDSEEAEGEIFKLFIEVDDKVKMGEPIIEMNKNMLEIEGFETAVAIAVLNFKEYGRIEKLVDFAREQKPMLKLLRY